MIIYNLNRLKSGDSVVLKDASENTYEYEVNEVFVVESDGHWAIDRCASGTW